MILDKTKKVLFLMDVGYGLESIIKEETNIQPENMLTIKCFGPVISNPFGDIMRSIIIAVFQENVEEIFVVGTSNEVNRFISLEGQFKSRIQTLDYLLQNSMPEFTGETINEWLNGKQNTGDNIKNCVKMICHHPLVPPTVKVRGLLINHQDGKSSVVEINTNKTA
ncbi:carbonic anhydrase [Niallia circulans]|jgi:carbonic anhydrase|uniref:carbonic anhydrase n=1 Tax=Niallia circulans TaxID=1397 RepID=UPI000BA590DF|nr:carbonic anhydrase [Niallia circulans]PAD89491.1 carbonic anhydrase [Niallia circulans]